MTHFKFACAAVAVMALVSTFMIGRSPSPLPAAVNSDTDSFDVVWSTAASSAALKSATVPNKAVLPIAVQTTSVQIAQATAPAETKAETQTKAEPTKKPSHDICRGKGKRYHNGGRSWRCRR